MLPDVLNSPLVLVDGRNACIYIFSDRIFRGLRSAVVSNPYAGFGNIKMTQDKKNLPYHSLHRSPPVNLGLVFSPEKIRIIHRPISILYQDHFYSVNFLAFFHILWFKFNFFYSLEAPDY